MKTPILDEFIEELQELKDGNFSLTKDLEERLIEFKNIKAAINYTHSCESDSEQLHTEVFNLANKLAINGYGNEALRMHLICNGM